MYVYGKKIALSGNPREALSNRDEIFQEILVQLSTFSFFFPEQKFLVRFLKSKGGGQGRAYFVHFFLFPLPNLASSSTVSLGFLLFPYFHQIKNVPMFVH